MTKKKQEEENEPTPYLEKGIAQRALLALIKGSGSAAMGVTVAAVEVELGDKAGKAVRVAMGVAGLASEVLIDPLENPNISQVGRMGLGTAAAITGYKTKTGFETYKESREQKERDRMISQFKIDMEDVDEKAKVATPSVGVQAQKPAKKTAKKTTKED